MLLAEILGELDHVVVEDSLFEGAKAVWTRRKGQLDRKYTCTSGPRQGSTVVNPYDCGLMPKRRFKLRVKGKRNG